MASRRRHHPVAIELDTMVESLMDTCEQVISEVQEPYRAVEKLDVKLRELRKRWLAEQTARAMMND